MGRKIKARDMRDDKDHYLKDYLWIDGTLCYWRNNQNYSDETKRKLEQRTKEMVDWQKDYKVYGKKNNS